MTWIKIDDDLPDHPKVAGLTDGAFRLYLTGLCYCSRHLTDGRIPEAVTARWGVRHPDRAASELMSAGLWTSSADGFEVVGYLEHQRSKVEVEALSVKRSKAGKRGGKATATAKQLARQTSSKSQAETDTESDTETKDDDASDSVGRNGSSSSGDSHRSVWLAYAELVADAQADPPAKRSAFLTSVARKAERERRHRLVEYLRVAPDTAADVLARWLYDDIDPVHIERPELDDDFTPASERRVSA